MIGRDSKYGVKVMRSYHVTCLTCGMSGSVGNKARTLMMSVNALIKSGWVKKPRQKWQCSSCAKKEVKS